MRGDGFFRWLFIVGALRAMYRTGELRRDARRVRAVFRQLRESLGSNALVSELEQMADKYRVIVDESGSFD